MSDRRTRRACQSVQRLRTSDHLVQLVSESALSEVPGAGAYPVARGPGAQLLDVPYVHVVFTLPHALLPLCYRNATQLYTWLFQASAATLREVAANPHHLGAEIGILSILHTWGQTLVRHPHVHCV